MSRLRFTPISLLKKSFKSGERSLSREEVAQRLMQMSIDVDSEQTIQAALDHPFSPFREGNSRAIIEYVYEPHPLANHVYRILKEARMPSSEDKILRKLRSYHLISWNFPFERLGILGDLRFVQLEGDHRWLLMEWELANDSVYQHLIAAGKTNFPLRNIPYLIQSVIGLPADKYIFVPQGDERFLIEREFVHLKHSPAGNEEQQEVQKQAMVEVAASMSNGMNSLEVGQAPLTIEENTVVDQVLEDLMGALIKLEKRSNEMKEEVVRYFESNDIHSIGSLLKEKERNETLLNKLKQIVDELSI